MCLVMRKVKQVSLKSCLKKNEPAGGLVVYFFFPADGRSSSRKRAYLRQLNSVIRTFELLNHIIFISFSGEI